MLHWQHISIVTPGINAYRSMCSFVWLVCICVERAELSGAVISVSACKCQCHTTVVLARDASHTFIIFFKHVVTAAFP